MVFDPLKYYESYPSKIILRPGYPARAQYKSTLMWSLYGKRILKSLGKIDNYADIGGCFGFGANSMAFQINKHQGHYPRTSVFELASNFVIIGRQLYPYINFIQGSILEYKETEDIFDLVTMFDLIEHVPEPEMFLSSISERAKFGLLMTPMETGGDWFGAKPPDKQGDHHPDGHINFYTPKNYLKLLDDGGWELIEGKFVKSVINRDNRFVLEPEELGSSPSVNKEKLSEGTDHRILYEVDLLKYFFNKCLLNLCSLSPYYFVRKILGGGYHLCLVKSRAYK